MATITPAFAPYLPSTALCREWLKDFISSPHTGWNSAWQKALHNVAQRHLNRTSISGAHGQPELLLSVPVRGGASTLKNLPPQQWQLSGHGRWKQEHLGAINAAYGKTAYFPHLFPIIGDIFASFGEGDSFQAFSQTLFDEAMRFTGLPQLISAHRNELITAQSLPRFTQLASEKSDTENTQLSILGVIFRKGPETPFTLLAPQTPTCPDVNAYLPLC